jgi:hypothetical protein
MRVQYRWRNSPLNRFDDWDDWGPQSQLFGGYPPGSGTVDEVEVRIVDDNGNVIPQTPPFKPAYYERKTRHGRPGGLAWFNTEPNRSEWIRREDVKPSNH